MSEKDSSITNQIIISDSSENSLDESDSEFEIKKEIKKEIKEKIPVQDNMNMLDINSMLNDQLKNMDNKQKQDFMKLFNTLSQSSKLGNNNLSNPFNIKPQSNKEALHNKLSQMKQKRLSKHNVQQKVDQLQNKNQLEKTEKTEESDTTINTTGPKKKKKKKKAKLLDKESPTK